MAGILIILFFIISIGVGIYRGAILQGIQIVGLAIGYLLSILLFPKLVDLVSLWIPYVGFDIENQFTYYPTDLLQNMDIIYFRLCAMLIIIIITWLITKLITYGWKKLKFMEISIEGNAILGGIFGFISAWFWTFFILVFLSVLTFENVQTMLANSAIADFIIRNTPLLSRQVFNLLLQGLGSVSF